MKINKDSVYPTKGRLFVQVDDQSKETSSGLIMAGSENNSAPVHGVVIRSGTVDFKEGDKVMFRRYSVDEIKVPNDEGAEDLFYFLDSQDILALIKVEELPVNKYPKIAEKKAIDKLNVYKEKHSLEQGNERSLQNVRRGKGKS